MYLCIECTKGNYPDIGEFYSYGVDGDNFCQKHGMCSVQVLPLKECCAGCAAEKKICQVCGKPTEGQHDQME